MTMGWLPLLSVFSVGSILTAIISSYLTSKWNVKNKLFSERKEAYIGLLEAWVRQENNNFDQQSQLDVGHWVLRSELVASTIVYKNLQAWKNSTPGSNERMKATNSLKYSIRSDLSF